MRMLRESIATKMSVYLVAHDVAGRDTVASQEFCGSKRLLPGKLDQQQRDRPLAAGHHQTVAGGFDHLAWSTVARSDPRLVHDQANGGPGGSGRRCQ